MKPEEKKVLENKYEKINEKLDRLLKECEEHMKVLKRKEINVLNKSKLTKKEMDDYMIDEEWI